MIEITFRFFKIKQNRCIEMRRLETIILNKANNFCQDHTFCRDTNFKETRYKIHLIIAHLNGPPQASSLRKFLVVYVYLP